jgi:hypothetical protein
MHAAVLCCPVLLQVLTILQGGGPFKNAGIVLEADAYINP